MQRNEAKEDIENQSERRAEVKTGKEGPNLQLKKLG